MKKALAVVIVVLLLFVCVACSAGGTPQPAANKPAAENVEKATNDSGESAATPTNDKKWEIVVVPKDSTSAWFVRMDKGIKRFVADTGINAYQKGPSETDAAMQVQVIEDLIAQGVDALCVIPVDPSALETVLKKAKDAGIVVVTHEGATTVNIDYDVEAFNNANYGAFIMDNLAEAMGEEGIYTTMVAHVTNASHNEWANGGIARQLEKYPNMKLLEAEPRVESEDNIELSYQKAKELFKKYPDLKGIFGTSGYDAPGIARAIDELGLKDKVFVCGTGMPQQNKEMMEKGIIKAVTLWDSAESGYAMCVLATKLLNGEKITAPIDLGAPGYEACIFNSDNPKVLEGAGWITVNLSNVDDFDF